MAKLHVYSCGFYFSRDFKRVALITKAKPDWQKGKLNGVGGSVEEGETFHQAMIREFQEESGVMTYTDQWHLFVSMEGMDWIVAFFRANAISDRDDVFSTDAEEQVAWYEVNALPDNVLPNLRWLIPLALDGSVRIPLQVKAQ